MTYIIEVSALLKFEDLHEVDQEFFAKSRDKSGEYLYELDADNEKEALDFFHDTIPIKVLDDFNISIVNTKSYEVSDSMIKKVIGKGFNLSGTYGFLDRTTKVISNKSKMILLILEHMKDSDTESLMLHGFKGLLNFSESELVHSLVDRYQCEESEVYKMCKEMKVSK